MTNRDVALLAFKLLGLWLVASAAIGVAGLPYYWEPQFEAVRSMTVFFTVLPLLVAVGIGVPIWFSAEWFAGRVFPDESQPTALDRLRGEPLVAVALSIIGLLFVCEALPVVVNGIALFTQSRFAGASILGPDPDQRKLIWSAAAKANVAAGIARLLIGLALIAGPARLAAAVARIRKDLTGTLAEEAAMEQTRGAAEMSYADDVREYCRTHYVAPARGRGETTVTIRAGDVHAALGYKNRMPLVCAAIGAKMFEEGCQVERLSVDGPLNGANATFTFRL